MKKDTKIQVYPVVGLLVGFGLGFILGKKITLQKEKELVLEDYGTPLYDGSGRGIRLNRNRGGCFIL